MISRDLVFVGIGGTVVALDRESGREVWRTRLGSAFVNLALQGDTLFASAHGEAYALDPMTGALIWRNKLKGLGMGFVTFAGGSQNQAATEAAIDDESKQD